MPKILPNGRIVDKNCEKCGLWKLCKSPRMEFEGSKHPKYLFAAEAPGAIEDEEGLPFQGDAGQILRQAIEDVGIDPQDCAFTNNVHCRPPENNLKAFPQAPELCLPNLLREIHSLRPKVVVLIGAVVVKSVLHKSGILSLHGQVFGTGDMKYVCIFHPAYLLRNDTPGTRQKFRDALKTVKSLVEGQKHKKGEKKRERIIIYDRKTAYEIVDEL